MQDIVYNSSTGEFTNLTGSSIGWVASNGYRTIRYQGKDYRAHRLAWYLTYGVWPLGDIDHINKDKLDNRITNLREATRSQNMQNCNRKVHGCRGVRKVGSKWKVQVWLGTKFKYYGYYTDYNEACEVSRKAHKELHKEFYRENS